MSDKERPNPEDIMDLRDSKGRFMKGNDIARLATGIKRPRDPSRKLQKDATQLAQEMLAEALPELVGVLTKKALNGEIQALNTALSSSIAKPKQETYLDPSIMAEAALLDPTSRTEYIHRKCLEGAISIETASELGAQCAREAEAQVLRTMKLIARDMKNGLDPAKAYQRLADVAEGINEKYTPVMIEGGRGVDE